MIGTFKARANTSTIQVLTSNNKPISAIPMLRQQDDNEVCYSLTDIVNGDLDYLSIYWCSVTMEYIVIHRYLKARGWLHCADIFKTICNNFVEGCSKITFDNIRFSLWGYLSKVSQNVFENERGSVRPAPGNERGSVRPAPGYPVCPDHNIKKILLHLL